MIYVVDPNKLEKNKICVLFCKELVFISLDLGNENDYIYIYMASK